MTSRYLNNVNRSAGHLHAFGSTGHVATHHSNAKIAQQLRRFMHHGNCNDVATVCQPRYCYTIVQPLQANLITSCGLPPKTMAMQAAHMCRSYGCSLCLEWDSNFVASTGTTRQLEAGGNHPMKEIHRTAPKSYLVVTRWHTMLHSWLLLQLPGKRSCCDANVGCPAGYSATAGED